MKKYSAIIIALLISVLVLTSCGKSSEVPTESSEATSVETESETSEEEKEASTAPLHFEVEGGILDYLDYEYVGKGFYSNGDGDYTHTIVINFDYTNKDSSAKNYMSDFRITAFQNGIELSKPSSYYPDGAPESFTKAHNNVTKDSSIKIGVAFILQDYSPITIIAGHNGGKEESSPMLLEIEPYEDNSFDIDLLYGLWEDQKSGKELTLTSSAIWFGKDGNGASTSDPKLWTDETMLYTNFPPIGNLTIDQSGDSLRMYNDECDFIQIENWSEKDAGSEKEPEEITLGETISLDFAEILFETYDVRDEIEASAMLVTSSGGSGGNISKRLVIEPEKAGTKYVLIQGTIKNLSSSAIVPKNMSAKLIINDDKELDCKVSIFDESASSLHEIQPMNTATIIIDASVAEDQVSSIEKADWLIGFGEQFSYTGGTTDISKSRYYYKVNALGAPNDSDSASSEAADDDAETTEETKTAVRAHQKEYTKLIYNNIDAVKVVQEALNEKGYSCGTPDGIIGNATIEAIKSFQSDYNLNETGEINDELIDVLGCWDKADLRFFFSFCDQNDNPVESFKLSERMYIRMIASKVGRALDINYTFKTIGLDGFILYNEMDVVYDNDGNPGFGGYIYFNQPDQAHSGTMKCEITDDDGELLGVTTAHVS